MKRAKRVVAVLIGSLVVVSVAIAWSAVTKTLLAVWFPMAWLVATGLTVALCATDRG